MKLKCKCKNCNKILKSDDSVFIRVIRYDTFGRRIKNLVFCTNCWDNTIHITHAEKVTSDFIKKLDNTDSFDGHTCGNCSHLILKDYEHHDGTCRILRLHRNFDSPCVHEEEMS